jgi:hypothetical protein
MKVVEIVGMRVTDGEIKNLTSGRLLLACLVRNVGVQNRTSFRLLLTAVTQRYCDITASHGISQDTSSMHNPASGILNHLLSVSFNHVVLFFASFYC